MLKVIDTLDFLHKENTISHIIEGGAPGADAYAKIWALKRKIPYTTFKANWERFGKLAGSVRNKEMLDIGKPDLVVAFPGGRGTANMIEQSSKTNVRILKVGLYD